VATFSDQKPSLGQAGVDQNREYLGTFSYFHGSMVFSKDVIMIAGAWTARIPANAKMEQPATTNQDYVIA